MFACNMFDLINDNVIVKGFFGCLEIVIPHLSQIHSVTLVDGNNPVVREMLIYYFSHFCILFVKDLRAKT
jgi:hypothetical protein